MITGDQRGTALAVARSLGIAAADSSALDGREIDGMSDAELAARLTDTSVFSRVSPEGKLRIVAGFQQRGDIVAMLGDGVNDAAALKKANVGVTMGGRGTDVAREAAAVVLSDDRFTTIGAAIEEGRVAFDNIRKFVFYLFSCNLAEIIVLLGASAAGLPPPLLPIQILWLNLVTDSVPALALAAEPAVPNVMRRPPRNPRVDIVSLLSLRSVAFYGFLVAGPVFFVMWWGASIGLTAERTTSISFMVLAFAQLLHLGNARDERAVVHPQRVIANTPALAAVIFSLVLQAATILWGPLRTFLHLAPLTRADWLVVVAASAIPAIVGQVIKLARAETSPSQVRNISRPA
jgi:magnesium-transporting ATPase (P-type)